VQANVSATETQPKYPLKTAGQDFLSMKSYWAVFRGFYGESECFNLLSGRLGTMGEGVGLGWNPYTQFYMSAELNQERQ